SRHALELQVENQLVRLRPLFGRFPWCFRVCGHELEQLTERRWSIRMETACLRELAGGRRDRRSLFQKPQRGGILVELGLSQLAETQPAHELAVAKHRVMAND